MTEHQAQLFGKAARAMRTARICLADEDPDGAINRAYYAAFWVVLAALTEVNETPRTHTGAHNRFYVHFVETGRIDSQFTQTLRRAFNLRHGADYNFDSVFAPTIAQELIDEVETFIQAVRLMLTPEENA